MFYDCSGVSNAASVKDEVPGGSAGGAVRVAGGRRGGRLPRGDARVLPRRLGAVRVQEPAHTERTTAYKGMACILTDFLYRKILSNK